MEPSAGTPASPRRTRPGNSEKHPAEVLFTTGVMQKRRTKAEKAADDKRLKDAKAAKEEAAKQGIECLALMEMEAEAKANDAKASKSKPRPRPQKWLKKTIDVIDKEPVSIYHWINDIKLTMSWTEQRRTEQRRFI